MDRVALTVGTVCEIGPVHVRRLSSGAVESAQSGDAVLAAAALDCDDAVVLVGARPVALDEVWCAVLEPLLDADAPAVLVHPSWWPATRIGPVREVARRLCSEVSIRPRSWLLAGVVGVAPLVEIGPHIVTITADGGALSGVLRRAAAPPDVADSVVRAVLRNSGRAPVWLDAPAGIPGADALAVQIVDRLRGEGRVVRRVEDSRLFDAVTAMVDCDEGPVEASGRGRRRLLPAAGAVAAAAALGTGIWAGAGDADSVGAPTVLMAALVEGHVTMQIPADWSVRRITTGPGSARVEVVSPTDGESVLHLTQAAVRDDSLAAAAAILRRGIDAEPAGIFVDFDPGDERAGRAAITYREIRPGHDIRWAVVVDGGTRIAIGCQSAVTSLDVSAACDEAVRSAHEIR